MTRTIITVLVMASVLSAVLVQPAAADTPFVLNIYHEGEYVTFWTRPIINFLTCQRWRVVFADEFQSGGVYYAYVTLEEWQSTPPQWNFYDSRLMQLNAAYIPEALIWPSTQYKSGYPDYRFVFMTSTMPYKVLSALVACRLHLPITFRSASAIMRQTIQPSRKGIVVGEGGDNPYP